MADELSADEIRSLLQLEPHPTCGFVRITYLSSKMIVPGGLAGTVRERAADGLRAVLHGDAEHTRAASSHPQ
jgi:hypothetical protein